MSFVSRPPAPQLDSGLLVPFGGTLLLKASQYHVGGVGLVVSERPGLAGSKI